jgi:hypothetical protein
MNTPELTPRDIVETAITKLIADTSLSPSAPFWMTFRSSLFRAFQLCDERLGNCLRSHKQAASEIERLNGLLKAAQGQIAELNNEIAERKLAR